VHVPESGGGSRDEKGSASASLAVSETPDDGPAVVLTQHDLGVRPHQSSRDKIRWKIKTNVEGSCRV
jgi:hypothetical protein